MQNEQFKGFPNQEAKCIFCSIVKGEIPSYEIDKNEDAIAILEINPISKAHTLIVPKQHVSSPEKIPETVLPLAQKITEQIKLKFNPKDIKIFAQVLLGHIIINVLPIYNDENQESKRKKATPEELSEIQRELSSEIISDKIEETAKEETKKPEIIKESKPEKLENVKLPKRIP